MDPAHLVFVPALLAFLFGLTELAGWSGLAGWLLKRAPLRVPMVDTSTPLMPSPSLSRWGETEHGAWEIDAEQGLLLVRTRYTSMPVQRVQAYGSARLVERDGRLYATDVRWAPLGLGAWTLMGVAILVFWGRVLAESPGPEMLAMFVGGLALFAGFGFVLVGTGRSRFLLAFTEAEGAIGEGS